MQPIEFSGMNKTLGPPKGDDGRTMPLPIFTDGKCCVSCWQLDESELAEIAKSGQIYLIVVSGQTQPPVWLSTKKPMSENPFAWHLLTYMGSAGISHIRVFVAGDFEVPGTIVVRGALYHFKAGDQVNEGTRDPKVGEYYFRLPDAEESAQRAKAISDEVVKMTAYIEAPDDAARAQMMTNIVTNAKHVPVLCERVNGVDEVLHG